MKFSCKPNLVAGAILLMLAAFFSIALILQPLDFGNFGSGCEHILFSLGRMLVSVYGISSVLIPVFLFVAAISCLSSQWTGRKSMRLLTAVVPFFTSVGVEKLCRAMLSAPDVQFVTLKIVLAAIIGLMLVIIEILAAGILADKIASAPKDGAAGGIPAQPERGGAEEEAGAADGGDAADDLSEEPVPDGGTVPVVEDDPFEGVFDEADENPASIITQEEFQALTDFDDPSEAPDELPESGAADDAVVGRAAEDSAAASEEYPDGPDGFDSEASGFCPEHDECSEDAAAPVGHSDSAGGDYEAVPGEDEAYVGADFDFEEPEEYDEYDAGLDDSDGGSENPFEDAEYIDSVVGQDSSWGAAGAGDAAADSGSALDAGGGTPAGAWQAAAPRGSVCSDEEPPSPSEKKTLDPDFFDIDMNEETPDEIAAGEASGRNDELVSDVFADMEADARNDARFSYSVAEQTAFEPAVIAEERPAADVPVPDDDGSVRFDGAAGVLNPPSPAVSPNRAQPKKPYSVPTALLEEYENDQYWIIDDATQRDSIKLKETLNEFNIEAEIIGIKKGPVVTMFELLPAPGVKLSKIVALQDNIALRLAASSVRIVAPIPGKAAVGIEVPNKHRSIVSFREMIEQDLPEFQKMAIPVVLGKDILGKPQLLDLVKTPHLLIAGATGAGKSVCVNSMILSILYKRSPQQVKLILIDPKIVELKLYNNIPHLLTPVITEPKRAFQSLQYCLCEMERRYALLDGMGVRDITSYNKRVVERNICTEQLPYIVVIIDEFADLMATTGKELESTVARLAAMSRAVGIHLVLATQRPSIDVITGLIKANIPTRIAFMVASKTDSRIIIDQVGAEMLLGKGDMLYASAVDPFPVRIQGTFVSDNDVENVVEYVKSYGPPEYIDDEIFVDDDDDIDAGPSLFGDGQDPLYEQALDIVIQAGKASASYIQRRLKIGYNRAARLVEEMEERGIVGPANGSKPREVIHVPG